MSEENVDLGEGRGENDNNFVVKSASMIIQYVIISLVKDMERLLLPVDHVSYSIV
jgi:hypothetical protein